jgi:hypothetical protein
MSLYQRLAILLFSILSISIAAAVLRAFLGAPPGGEELAACQELLRQVGNTEYVRLMDQHPLLDDMCRDFGLHTLRISK